MRARDAGGVGPARVHAVHDRAVTGQVVGEQLGEHHLHPLGAGVGRPAGVRPLAELGVVDVEGRGVHAAGGDEHDPRRGGGARAGAQHGAQLAGEQERSEDVRGERRLVALGGLGALGGHDAGVVDEAVHRGLAVAHLRRVAPDVGQGGHVAGGDVDGGARVVGADRSGGLLAPLRVAHHHLHARAEGDEAADGGRAQAAAGAGHEDRAAGEAPARQRRPARPPHGVPQSGVTGHHQSVQRGVDEAGELHDAQVTQVGRGRPDRSRTSQGGQTVPAWGRTPSRR